MKKSFNLIIVLFSIAAMADEVSVNYGIGAFNDANHFKGQVKIGEFCYRRDLIDSVYWQHKIGFWGDGTGDGRKSSGFASTGPGLKVDLKPIEIRSGWGLAAITTPDNRLGGAFPQFNGEFYIGLRDNKGAGIGMAYEHISSAGIWKPNMGRDFFVLQLSERW